MTYYAYPDTANRLYVAKTRDGARLATTDPVGKRYAWQALRAIGWMVSDRATRDSEGYPCYVVKKTRI